MPSFLRARALVRAVTESSSPFPTYSNVKVRTSISHFKKSDREKTLLLSPYPFKNHPRTVSRIKNTHNDFNSFRETSDHAVRHTQKEDAPQGAGGLEWAPLGGLQWRRSKLGLWTPGDAQASDTPRKQVGGWHLTRRVVAMCGRVSQSSRFHPDRLEPFPTRERQYRLHTTNSRGSWNKDPDIQKNTRLKT